MLHAATVPGAITAVRQDPSVGKNGNTLATLLQVQFSSRSSDCLAATAVAYIEETYRAEKHSTSSVFLTRSVCSNTEHQQHELAATAERAPELWTNIAHILSEGTFVSRQQAEWIRQTGNFYLAGLAGMCKWSECSHPAQQTGHCLHGLQAST